MSKALLEAVKVTETDRWQAVLAKDARFNGAFFVAVRSTGIYCRPSCPARVPRRNQVVFFETLQEAERAGYRPCLRCRPRELIPRDVEIAQRVCHYVAIHLKDSLTLATLSAEVGLSPHHFQRIFKRVMGITPRQYVEAQRLNRLKEDLQKGEDVTRALYAAGYGSSSRLYERSDARMGMTPATYRRGGQGMRIGYTIVDCPLGRLLVAATERGISAINVSSSDTALEKALRREYPAAEIHHDKDSKLTPWIRALVSHLSGRRPHLDLPIDVQATAFQWRVWEELRKIPYGQTRSYTEIAQSIGNPKARRAVARACATNPVPIVIPCHRVVRADGGLGGYGLGVERKRALLEREGASASADA